LVKHAGKLLLGMGFLFAIQPLMGVFAENFSPEGSASATSVSPSDTETSLVAVDTSSMEVKDFCTVNIGATDNTACVQKAIDKAGSMGGGRVHFSPGTYLFNGTLNLNKSDIVLDCGDMAAILRFDNGVSDVIRIDFNPNWWHTLGSEVVGSRTRQIKREAFPYTTITCLTESPIMSKSTIPMMESKLRSSIR
jgi:hypothetical protein